MGKSGLLERQKARDRVIKLAQEQTTRQYMTDMLILTLNDPEVMGKDVFGYERLMRVLVAWEKNYDLYFDALTKKPEADYVREKIDRAIQQITSGKGPFSPFEERYEYLPEIKYDKEG